MALTTFSEEALDGGDASSSLRARHVAVIVLGDVGRSPRMQYHAASLLRRGVRVTLIGYEGEGLVPDLAAAAAARDDRLRVVRFNPASSSSFKGALKPLYYASRLRALVGGTVDALWRRTTDVPDCLMVQNPPSVPSLFLAWLYCRTKTLVREDDGDDDITTARRRPGLLVDWHNLGYTMFPYDKDQHPACRLVQRYERWVGRRADQHFCVSEAMRDFLINGDFVRSPKTITVLRDRPPKFFRPSTPKEIHEVVQKYGDEDGALGPLSTCFGASDDDDDATIFTRRVVDANGGRRYEMRRDRPALIVSSTSWTPDEDFSVLLDALLLLEKRVVELERLSIREFPRVVVIVTGKGPLKAHYEASIRDAALTRVAVRTLWLDAADYPRLVGAADLGVSLHTSTSGVDLPMKVLDMFGCGVPVLAAAYDCVGELVVEGVNGRLFRDATGLSDALHDCLCRRKTDEGVATATLRTLRRGVVDDATEWDDNWDRRAAPVVRRACGIPVHDDGRRCWRWTLATALVVAIVAWCLLRAT